MSLSNLEKGMEVIKGVVATLPDAPGVYRMLDKAGKILYVGKAKNLRKRVTSYTKEEGHPYRILMMIAATSDMEIVRTESETAAFLLENDLIKRFMPPYNVLLKDAKTFAHILIRQDHPFPQILKVRGAKQRKGKYFGPFTSAHLVNETLALFQKIFLLRNCTDANFKSRTRPCLMHQIKRCCAPCVGYVTMEEYAKLVQQAKDFFDGKDHGLQERLSAKMQQASDDEDYELAALYRDRIRALNQIQLGAGNDLAGVKSADFIALYREADQVAIHVYFIRNEKNYGAFSFFPQYAEEGTFEAFIGQLYKDYSPPAEIILSEEIESAAAVSEALGCKITTAPRGAKARILDEAMENAKTALGRRQATQKSWEKDFNALEEMLGLKPINKIEIYDNSHIQAAFALGVAVCATRDGFSKKDYRRFNIKEHPGDDTGMMQEVLRRRIKRGLLDGNLPDLMIIDGGKGQLNAALKVVNELEAPVKLLAIAKGEKRNAGGETLYTPDNPPIVLDNKDALLFFVERLRDEAHRFAIGSHRLKRGRETIVSELDNIEGIGAKRRKMLLQYFGSVKGVREASLSELKKVAGLDDKTAKKVYDYFKN